MRLSRALVTLAGLTSAASTAVRAQLPDSSNAGRSGIYRTADDFQAGRLAFAITCARERHRIDRHTLLDRPYLDVTHAGERTRLLKTDVFGYRECDGSVVRFTAGGEFTVLAAARAVLYVRPVAVAQAKGFRMVPLYFFSRTPADPVVPLTRAAVKDAFPADHALHDRIDQTFRRDDELAAFDDRHGQYRLLRLLGAPAAAAPPAPVPPPPAMPPAGTRSP